MTVLINLREVRRARNIKQDELAQAVGVRQSMISGIETGRVNVKAKTCERLGFAGRGEGIVAEAVVLISHGG